MLDLYEQINHKTGNNIPMKIYRTTGVYLHWHDEYEFIIIEKGNITCTLNGKAVKLDKNSVVLVQSGIMHSVQCGKDSEITAIVVSPSLWSNKIDESLFNGKITYQSLFNNSDVIDSSVIGLLKEITEIYDNSGCNYEFILKSKFTKIFEILISNNRFTDVCHKFKKKPDGFQTLISYIHENYVDKITLDTLSSLSFYSPSYIIRLFKKYTNLTPAEYIIQYRLSLAQKMLLNSSESNLSISLACGFKSEAYFIHAFKKRYGKTPQVYRKGK